MAHVPKMVPPFEIDVFHGEVSPQLAHVYARVGGLPGGKEWTIAGRLRGPQCRHAKTLPTTHSFVDLGAGQSLLARATIPDPCFWSPDLPALYQVSIEIRQRHQERAVQTFERELGIRFLGTRGNNFYWESKRWVLRAVSNDCLGETRLAEWRAASAAMLVVDPSDELCREASREGVLLVAKASHADVKAMRRFTQWACVGIVIVPVSQAFSREQLSHFPNVIFARAMDPASPNQMGNDSSTLLIDESAVSTADQVTRRGHPTIVMRRLRGTVSLTEARNQCDLLQSDLAPLGDFAGYVIDAERF